ncbi:MAG: hypothetical protein V3V81_08110 [Candidatus Bathyarchaeia archaeon]
MISYIEQLYSAVTTTTGNSSATPVIVKHGKEATIYLDITAVSGTNPTLDLIIKIQDSLSTKWHTLATFDQKTSTGTDVGYIEYAIGEKMALFYTIGGTNTPTFTFSVNVGIKER